MGQEKQMPRREIGDSLGSVGWEDLSEKEQLETSHTRSEKPRSAGEAECLATNSNRLKESFEELSVSLEELSEAMEETIR